MINSMAFKNKNDILASAPKDGFLLITSFPLALEQKGAQNGTTGMLKCALSQL